MFYFQLSLLNLIPEKAVGSQDPVTVLELPSSSMVCPKDMSKLEKVSIIVLLKKIIFLFIWIHNTTSFWIIPNVLCTLYFYTNLIFRCCVCVCVCTILMKSNILCYLNTTNHLNQFILTDVIHMTRFGTSDAESDLANTVNILFSNEEGKRRWQVYLRNCIAYSCIVNITYLFTGIHMFVFWAYKNIHIKDMLPIKRNLCKSLFLLSFF